MRKYGIKSLTVLLFLISCFLISCSNGVGKKLADVADEVVDQVNNVTDMEDSHVLGVKNGHPDNHPKCKYGDVFDEFFASPTWKYFKATSGEEVVEFTGYCKYHDVEVKARLQFILDKDGKTFETGALSFNDVPQNQLITVSMIYKAFSDYIEKHNIKEDTELEEKDIEDIFATDDNTNFSESNETQDSYRDDNQDYNNDLDYETDYYVSEYVLPESSTRYLESYELPTDKEDLRIARNEIFARHGRMFKDKKLQEHFDGTPWYVPSVKPENFDEKVLNEFEKYNLNLIKEAEQNVSNEGGKEIYFAGMYEGNGTIEMEEYSSPEDTAHGVNAGYIRLSGFGDERDNQEVQIYRSNPKAPNYYEDFRGFMNITVKEDRIIVKGVAVNLEDIPDSPDISGTYHLKRRFPRP